MREAAEAELDSGEQIQWIDRPEPKLFTGASTVMFLFGIPWTAFALFWTVAAAWGVLHEGGTPGPFMLFPLFGLPFILIGIGLLSGPWWNRRKQRNTVYMITDRRAVIIEVGKTTKITSYEPDQMDKIYRTEKSDGTGNVYFTRRQWKDMDGDRRGEDIGFERVAQVRDVEKLLKKMADNELDS